MSGPTFADVTPEPEDTTPEQELPTLSEWPEGTPLPPTIEVADHPCVMISCSACLAPYSGDDVTLHFDSVAEAITVAVTSDWVLLEDGTILCEQCATTERCRRFGHGTIRDVSEFTTSPGFWHLGYSYCERCGERVNPDADPAVPEDLL